MAGLEEISRSQEGVVSVQGVDGDGILLVSLDATGQVGKLLENDFAQLELCQQARGSGCRDDRHALEEGLQRVEHSRQPSRRVKSRKEAPRPGDHEGRKICPVKKRLRTDA